MSGSARSTSGAASRNDARPSVYGDAEYGSHGPEQQRHESRDRPDRAAHGSRIPRRWPPSACSTRRSSCAAGPANRARASHRPSSPRGRSRRRSARRRSEAEAWRHQTRSAFARTRRETAPTVARCAPHRRPGAAITEGERNSGSVSASTSAGCRSASAVQNTVPEQQLPMLGGQQRRPDVLADREAILEIRAVAGRLERRADPSNDDRVVQRSADHCLDGPGIALDARHRPLKKVAAALRSTAARNLRRQEARQRRTRGSDHPVIIRPPSQPAAPRRVSFH